MPTRWLRIVLLAALFAGTALGCGSSREKNRNKDYDRPLPSGRK